MSNIEEGNLNDHSNDEIEMNNTNISKIDLNIRKRKPILAHNDNDNNTCYGKEKINLLSNDDSKNDMNNNNKNNKKKKKDGYYRFRSNCIWFIGIYIFATISAMIGGYISIRLVMKDTNEFYDRFYINNNDIKYFVTTNQLRVAVEEYLYNNVNGIHNDDPNSTISLRYGYPIDVWDVSRIHDFSRLFNPDLYVKPIVINYNDYNMIDLQPKPKILNLTKWNVSSATSFYAMFANSLIYNIVIGNISTWDVSKATNFSCMFLRSNTIDKLDLSNWNMNNAIDLSHMFESSNYYRDYNYNPYQQLNNEEDDDQPMNTSGGIGGWEEGNDIFTQIPDGTLGTITAEYVYGYNIGSWDVSKARYMDFMFAGMSSFCNDISKWNTSQVKTMVGLFQNTRCDYGYNILNLSSWNVANVMNMSQMFECQQSLNCLTENFDLSGWDVGKVKDMSSMFYNVNFLGNISSWDVSSVLSMKKMFQIKSDYQDFGFRGINHLDSLSRAETKKQPYHDLNHWDVSNVGNMDRMFAGVQFIAGISKFDVRNVKSMVGMFSNYDYGIVIGRQYYYGKYAPKLNSSVFHSKRQQPNANGINTYDYDKKPLIKFEFDVSNWDVSNVEDLSFTFAGLKLNDHDFSKWDVGKVKIFDGIFAGSSLFHINISKWDVSKATSLMLMFYQTELFNENISNWDVSNNKDYTWMFAKSKNFDVDISNWNVSSLQWSYYMFSGASMFRQNLCPWKTLISSDAKIISMFEHTNCRSTITDGPHKEVNEKNGINCKTIIGPFCFDCTL